MTQIIIYLLLFSRNNFNIFFSSPSRVRFGTRRHTANKSASRHLAKEAKTASCPFWTLEVPEGHSGSRKTIHRMPHTSV